MLQDVLTVKPLTDYKLHLLFEDGMEGIVDLSKMIEFTGVFAPLKDRSFFGDRVEKSIAIAPSEYKITISNHIY
ncbi:MAG: DUF2442 domain-containing protein [Pseudanabaena sp. ELA645]|jgi:hypothetical protein